MAIQDAFNYGMAVWGDTLHVDSEPFARAVELDRSEQDPPDNPNYLQCMAVAYWAVGDTVTSLKLEDRARRAVKTIRLRLGSVVSCWRYRTVSMKAFTDDLDEIRALINGDASRIPRFMMTSSELEKTARGESRLVCPNS